MGDLSDLDYDLADLALGPEGELAPDAGHEKTANPYTPAVALNANAEQQCMSGAFDGGNVNRHISPR